MGESMYGGATFLPLAAVAVKMDSPGNNGVGAHGGEMRVSCKVMIMYMVKKIDGVDENRHL